MGTFRADWIIAALLIDYRGRYSLTHFQIVLWTIVILSSWLSVFVSSGFNPATLTLSPELLGLMGISTGSAVLATGVKAAKDTIGSGADVAREGRILKRRIEEVTSGGLIQRTLVDPEPVSPHFSQIWLEEEGEQAERVVSITKYQNFVFTLVALLFYIVAAWKQMGIPTLPENAVWLIGISHAGYVGGKVPNKH